MKEKRGKKGGDKNQKSLPSKNRFCDMWLFLDSPSKIHLGSVYTINMNVLMGLNSLSKNVSVDTFSVVPVMPLPFCHGLSHFLPFAQHFTPTSIISHIVPHCIVPQCHVDLADLSFPGVEGDAAGELRATQAGGNLQVPHRVVALPAQTSSVLQSPES